MLFSEIIKAIRKELGITQEELAAKLYVSFSTINRWENGHCIPKKLAIAHLIDICKQYSVNNVLIDDLEQNYIQ